MSEHVDRERMAQNSLIENAQPNVDRLIATCLVGMALTMWNINIAMFGSIPKCELGPSGTVKSIETLC